jgi:hypothetical protein
MGIFRVSMCDPVLSFGWLEGQVLQISEREKCDIEKEV